MNSDKLLWANNLRATATVAVIVLHVASTVSSNYPAIQKSYYLVSIFYDSMCRWGVPIFFMLSGSFALEKYDNNIRKFFIKMLNRIIIPFAFWSIVYLLFFSWHPLMENKNTSQQLDFILKQFLSGTASHLWFVYIIVSMYLTFPILSKWTKAANEKEYVYFLALWLFFILIDPFLSQFDNSFDYTFFSGYIGYVVLGNYLAKMERRFNTRMLILLLLAAALYTAIRTYIISVHDKTTNEVYMSNFSLNVCMMAACVYLIFKSQIYIPHPVCQRLLNVICEHSYGIYLSHIFILNIFLLCGLKFYFINPIISIPVISITCLLVAIALIIVMKKIPGLKQFAG